MSSLAKNVTSIPAEPSFKNEKLRETYVGLSLEGIQPSHALMKDFMQIDAGKMTYDEAIARTIARARKIDADNERKNNPPLYPVHS
jgi:hypothetical protein